MARLTETLSAADADRPATARLASCSDGASAEEDAVAPSHRGAAGLHIAEKAIPGIADSTGDRCQRFNLRLIRESCGEKVGVVATGIRPIIAALETEHPDADLIIAAGLDAANGAACGVAPEIRSEGRVTRNSIDPIRVGPKDADIAADIASGPGEIGDRRG